MFLQCVSSCSISDSAAQQKSDVLQSEEGKEEEREICDRKVHEAALWPLDQTQGTNISLLTGKNQWVVFSKGGYTIFHICLKTTGAQINI